MQSYNGFNMDQANINKYRSLVAGVETAVPLDSGKFITAVNFDNAATTPPFKSVIKDISDFLPWYSSIHRGKGYKSQLSTDIYEQGRKVIIEFVNGDEDNDIVIYSKNTTDSINMLAYVLSQQKNGKDVILSTWMEHAANDLPWRDKFNIDYVDIDELGRLDMSDLELKLRKYGNRIKLLAVTGVSNVTGYINDIYKIAHLAHQYGTQIFVDGAQLIPHMKLDMKQYGSKEHIDFLAFSAHKMYAPYGAGVLIGPKTIFETGLPYAQGGSAISIVTHNRILWEQPPMKEEAGTPNLLGVVAMISAVKQLQKIGMDNALAHEKKLLSYAHNRIKKIGGITLYNYPDKQDTIGVIPFNIEGVHHSLMSAILSYEAGIAVRNGFFCAHPYCERLLGYSEKDMELFFENCDTPFPGMVRASFGLYNNYNEIDRFVNCLSVISQNKDYFISKYGSSRSQYNIKNQV